MGGGGGVQGVILRKIFKTINCRVVPVAGYVINVCILRKGGIEELN